MRTLHQLVKDEGRNHSKAAEILKHAHMLIILGQMIHTLKELKNDLIQLLDKGRLKLNRWASNNPEVVAQPGHNIV